MFQSLLVCFSLFCALLSLVSLCDGTADAGFLLKRLYSIRPCLTLLHCCFRPLIKHNVIHLVLFAGENLWFTTKIGHLCNFCIRFPSLFFFFFCSPLVWMGLQWESSARLSLRFLPLVLLHIESGLCGKTERDRGWGAGRERKQRMSQHVFKICVSAVVH